MKIVREGSLFWHVLDCGSHESDLSFKTCANCICLIYDRPREKDFKKWLKEQDEK